jgi:hypothetical protein
MPSISGSWWYRRSASSWRTGEPSPNISRRVEIPSGASPSRRSISSIGCVPPASARHAANLPRPSRISWPQVAPSSGASPTILAEIYQDIRISRMARIRKVLSWPSWISLYPVILLPIENIRIVVWFPEKVNHTLAKSVFEFFIKRSKMFLSLSVPAIRKDVIQ